MLWTCREIGRKAIFISSIVKWWVCKVIVETEKIKCEAGRNQKTKQPGRQRSTYPHTLTVRTVQLEKTLVPRNSQKIVERSRPSNM